MLTLLLASALATPAPPPGQLTLVAPPLIEGTTATFTVGDAAPGERVWVIGSLDPSATASCPPQIAPLCLPIGGRLTPLGSAIANSNGVARLDIDIPELPGPPLDVAGVAVSLQSQSISNRVDLTIAETDPGSVGLDVCMLNDQIATRPPYRELLGPSTPGPFFPGFSGGAGTHVITDDVAYRQFQSNNGMALDPVDFTTSDVLALTYINSSTCGVSIADYEVWVDPGTGDAVLDATVDDASAGCQIACAAFGFAALVVEVPKSVAPEVCLEVTGPCLP